MYGKHVGIIAALAALVLSLGAAAPAHAHAFGERFTLPLPLWLYVAAAAAVVGLSFVITAVFFRSTQHAHGYPRFNLLRWRLGRMPAHRFILMAFRLASVGVFVLILWAGFFGHQDPLKNITPTLVWVVWWVGLAFVSSLLGNIWALINPWKVIFSAAEFIFCRGDPRRSLSLGIPYPAGLGVWPAVILLLGFGWLELAWDGADKPASIALAVVGYSLISWVGMFVFGKETWIRQGDAFALFAGLLARFSPTEVRVVNPAISSSCSSPECRRRSTETVDCYECFARADGADRQWNLRPYAVGLLTSHPVHPSMMAFILLTLSTVTFDGFIETPAWANIVTSLVAPQAMTQGVVEGLLTLGLLACPILLLGIYMFFCQLIYLVITSPAGSPPTPNAAGYSAGDIAGLFVLSIIPISIAYHLAHYINFLLVTGQFIIPLASDPFGLGWNLLGTVGYEINIGIISVKTVWYLAVSAIVVAHVIAVYLAHVVALGAFKDNRRAIRSQYPMLVLMVGFTMLSLWLFAQPIVTPAG
jgi:hypothetical protein